MTGPRPDEAQARDRLVTSPANPTVKRIRSLAQRKYRELTGQFMAEGMRVLTEAVELGVPIRTLAYAAEEAAPGASARRGLERLRTACVEAGGEVLAVTRPVLEKLSRKDNPQSVVGVFDQARAGLEEAEPAQGLCWVALEGIRDPGNLGTVLRTGDGVGAAGVILLGATCDPYSPEAVRGSMGAVFGQRIVRAGADAFLAWCRRQGVNLVGSAPHGAIDYRAADYSAPLVLLMGNEQSGLPENLQRACRTLVSLPMRGKADSLNLSVATGVLLYEVLAQREGQPPRA
jgi:TrmH family RNA methyltransferase